MKRLMLGAACAALASTLGMSGAVMAGVAPTGGDVHVDSKGAGGYVGLGASYAPDYEGGDDYEASPALFGKYTWESGRFVNLGGTAEAGSAARLSVNVIPLSMRENWHFGPLLQYRQKRGGVDNDKVDDMNDIDAAIEAGLFLSYLRDRWTFTLAGAFDVSSEYDGFISDLKVQYTWPMSKTWTFTFGASTSYADGNYMDTYFGVDSRDAVRSGLDTYNADAGFQDVGLSASAHFTPWKRWGILAGVNYYRLVGDADDSSPVTDEGSENQIHGVVAVTYRF